MADHFEMVLEAVEGDEGWATNRLSPGKVILGNLDGIEAGVRQMIRKRPLQVAEVELPSGESVTVPTLPETLRIKAFLVVRRNQTRDYLDLADPRPADRSVIDQLSSYRRLSRGSRAGRPRSGGGGDR